MTVGEENDQKVWESGFVNLSSCLPVMQRALGMQTARDVLSQVGVGFSIRHFYKALAFEPSLSLSVVPHLYR